MPIPELWGKPITIWLGMLTFSLFLSTLTVGLLIFKGRAKIPLKTHRNLAFTTLGVALVHASFAFVAWFLTP